MRNRTPKRAKQEREYKKLAIVHLNDNPVCEAGLDCCSYNSEQIHHKKGRIGNLLTDVRYFLAVCFACPHWIELNPKEAFKRGFSVSRLN